MATPTSTTDRTHDILRTRRRPLDAVFAPRSVAVIGASAQPRSAGALVLKNLQAGFRGTIVPVTPAYQRLAGLDTYASIGDVPGPVDLAILATPATTVPALIGECVDAGVAAAIVLAAGFRESGEAGRALEVEVLRQARRGDLRIVGPNCLGVMRPPSAYNATFASMSAMPGSVAFVSQSGALCTAILDWSLAEHVGFSAFVSAGAMLDVGWGELVDYLGDDPHTTSIILYMELINDARAFVSAAREVALTKPIIVLKAGRAPGAARAVASHTGALVGADDVIDAVFRRCGVVRVDRVADLFYMADVLSKQPHPAGPRLLVVTNAGGPGVIAADALLERGGQLAELSEATLEALDKALPPSWSRGNPVDLLGDADAERYARALEIAARSGESDGVLVIRTPDVSAEPARVAEAVIPFARLGRKPILACWMGGPAVARGEAALNHAGIPTFPYPDTAARIFAEMWGYSLNLKLLYETPQLPERDEPDHVAAGAMIEAARAAGRTLLNEAESKQLLVAYGIPTVPTTEARSADEAIAHADAIGYPVVLKLLSPAISHKSDVGGVRLNLYNAEAVRAAYMGIAAAVPADAFDGVTVQPMVSGGVELIVGSTVDQLFGPVLLFGAGGVLAEYGDDRALALPPLTTTLARRMIEQTRIHRALGGARGRPPTDPRALEQLLVRFSRLVVEQPAIREIDVNPLLALGDQGGAFPPLLALDARVVLHSREVVELPRPSIRPYPAQYISQWALRDGTPVTIRPIRPEDEPLLIEFHRTLGERSVFLRYFQPLALDTRIAHERLTRMCFIDYDRQMALVAELRDAQGAPCIAAVGRMIRLPGRNSAEYAGLVSDLYQANGLGTEILSRLLNIARDEGVARVVAETMGENRAMQRVFQKLGFRLKRVFGDDIVKAELDLE